MGFRDNIRQKIHFLRVLWDSFRFRSFFDASFGEGWDGVLGWLAYQFMCLSGFVVDGKPTWQQEHAILCDRNRILCIAGPGSGKTMVLTRRISNLLRNKGVPPEDILAVTFTKKAANQMKDRIKRILKSNPEIRVEGLQLSTFHSFCNKVLRSEGSVLLDNRYEILDDRKQRKLLRYLIDENDFSLEDFDRLYCKMKKGTGVYDFIDDCLDIINYVQNERVSLSTIKERSKKLRGEPSIEIYKRLIVVIEDYFEFVESKSKLDFNMLLQKTLDLLNTDTYTLNKLRGKYNHILVDEYQDVNELQVELIELLTTEDNNLFVVGDDWQSIYGWRGSRVEYILNFGKMFPEAETIKLFHNFRSTRNIVDASSELIQHNKNLFKKKIRSNKPQGDKVVVLRGEDVEDEFNKILAKIKVVLEDGYGLGDIYVLLRTRQLRDGLCYFLERNKVPYVKRERMSPEDEPENGAVDKITVLTAHSAKGLENKVVFICGLGSGGHFPCSNTNYLSNVLKGVTDRTEQAEEERRLFYVAMTRAEEKLFITAVGPSEYLKQLPKKYVVVE